MISGSVMSGAALWILDLDYHKFCSLPENLEEECSTISLFTEAQTHLVMQ